MTDEIALLKDKIASLETRLFALEEKLGLNSTSVKNNTNQPSKTLQSSNRDKTKYVFRNKILPKNRLVFAIVSDYIKTHNDLTLQDLQNIFDKSSQGSLQVIEDYDKVVQIKDYTKRYFCAENELLTLSDGKTVAICTQWGIFNINKFLTIARQLGYEVEEI